MADPYAILGVPREADDGTIRRRYLELTREFAPEQHPERFAAVRSAYESIKDLERRTQHRLFDAGKEDTIDSIIEEAACRTLRHRAGLRTILSTVLPAN